jgi:AcrR family transcriptional regulator
MIDTIGAKGYAASTVSDVIKRAGVSRKAFYEHFDNKEQCFLATYDSIAAIGQGAVASAFSRTRGLPDSVQATLEELFELATARPDGLRVLMVEIGAAGPAGIERREQLVVGFEDFLRQSLGLPPGPGPIPNPVLRGVIGGLLHVLYGHLRRGERAQLRTHTPELVHWTTSYWPAPATMMNLVDPAPRELHLELTGGRAPGSLSLNAASNRRRRLPRGENGMSRSFVVHSQRERILDAVTNLTARKGYAALTVEGVAAEASVSLQAFYEHFSDKEDAFLVAYEIGHDKALALVEQAFHAQPDWRLGVRAGISALFRLMAAEPAYAHMALVDVLAATERTSERAFKGETSYAQLLLPGLPNLPDRAHLSEVMVEAITGGVFELMLHHALQGRIRELPAMVPRATYFALAPFIGAEAAGDIATAPLQ